jgi:hypothetical protein
VTGNGLAALAERLETVMRDSVSRVGGPYAALGSPEITIRFDRPAFAAAILGERGVYLEHGLPTPDEIDTVLAQISATGYASEAVEVVERWFEDRFGYTGDFTAKEREG